MGRQRAARPAHQAGADGGRRGQLDECRCRARWSDDRLRPAGRHLHHADRRRHADADRRGAGLRASTALLARWPAHRLHLRPGRRRQYLGHERRWQRQAAGDEGGFPPAQPANLEPGRALHCGQEAFHHRPFARHRRGVALSRLGRRRGTARQARQRGFTEGTGRTDLCARWQKHLLHPQRVVGADLRICAELAHRPVRHRTLRHRHRRGDDGGQRGGRIGAPDPVARRQADRLRPPR